MLQEQPQSLIKTTHFLITITFFALVIANTSVLIWSYSTTWQYVKLIILVQTDSRSLASTIPAPHFSYELLINEFTLSLNDILTNFWKAPAYSPALAIFISTYFYPYCKLIVYLIVYFIPLSHEHQKSAVFQINQFNKLLFIPLVAIIIQCSTFSFTIVAPTQQLQNLTDVNAESYPGNGLVVNMFVIFVYAIIDYMLYAVIIKSKNNKSLNNYDLKIMQHKIQKRYDAKSYAGVVWKSLFIVIVISNLMLYFQASTRTPVRYQLDGVLSKFVPEKYMTNNLFETGNILLNTSLLNNTTATFLYYIWIYVFIVFPIIVCVLLIFMWIVPLFDNKYGFIYVPKYFVNILWFVQSWAAFDVFLLCQFGATQANIENGTKYMLDTTFPEYCGVNGIVTNAFGEDCSWADAWFVYPLILYIVNVIVNWGIVIYTSKVFSITEKDKQSVEMQYKVVDINA